ncbi:hypothetical protein BJ878DRAFT_417617 [Calycina marina]|uniref:C2H2-type domain-containing protein n=1 Tax=Calycina marina TaxID=1763456 RepID=A0A9P8CGW2_9HELO|nr:hypothetical protein BJ878DRAFT_417617 [Calycina marina]
MSLVSSPATHQHPSNIISTNSSFDPSNSSVADINNSNALEILRAFNHEEQTSMDRSVTEFTQSGLPTPYPNAFIDPHSEESPADHASAVRSPYHQHQEARSAPDYAVQHPHPTSARSTGSFPEHIQRQQYYAGSNHSGSSIGNMAQPASPLPLSLQERQSSHMKSDEDVPIDPSIAQTSSPSYPPQNAQYSPYPPQDMQHGGYPGHPQQGAMYQQPRPDWAGYAGQPHQQQHAMPYASGAHTPTSAASAGARPGQPHLSQVYSFVPIPGAQQHKRPRRRYEEIERMYKCGWEGCEKAYGTLNHLNAHVTMQSHGAKRTPEEFKEIRKEWKARKKEEESQRKQDDERHRGPNPEVQHVEGHGAYQQSRPQLPPIGYQPSVPQPSGQYQQSAAPSGGVQQLQEYSNQQHMQYGGYPASPYGAQPSQQQMYSQRPITPSISPCVRC